QAVDRRLGPARTVDARLHCIRRRPEIATPPVVVPPADGAQVKFERRHLRKRNGRRLHLPSPLVSHVIPPLFAACRAPRVGDLLAALDDRPDADVVGPETCVCHVTSPPRPPCGFGASHAPPRW